MKPTFAATLLLLGCQATRNVGNYPGDVAPADGAPSGPGPVSTTPPSARDGGQPIDDAFALRTWPPAANCDFARSLAGGSSYPDTFRALAVTLRLPPGWTVTAVGDFYRDSPDPKDQVRLVLGNDLRLDAADALKWLDNQLVIYPSGARLNWHGHPAVLSTTLQDAPVAGCAAPCSSLPPSPKWWFFSLSTVEGDVFAELSGGVYATAQAGVFCEVEAILSSLAFEP
jgi:hypothetical protein